MSLHAGAQGTYNIRHDLFGESEGEFGLMVEVLDSGKVLALFNRSYTLDGLFYSSGVSSIVLNDQGEVLEEHRLHIPERANYIGWANAGDRTASGLFLIGGANFGPGDTYRAAVYWMNTQGIVEDFIELELPGIYAIGRQAKEGPDGSLFLCGAIGIGEQELGDGFVTKFSPAGEVLWYANSGAIELREGFSSLVLMPDGGVIAGGQKQISGDDYDPWVVRFDSSGQEVWSAVYGTPVSDGNGHITIREDSTVIIATYLSTGEDDSDRVTLMLIDQDGSLLWEKRYGPARRTALMAAKEVIPTGDIIAGGFAYVTPNQHRGLLLRTTADGDSLWMREYAYADDQVAVGRGAFYDVEPTPDGGFVAVGVAIVIPGIYSQDVWVIKVDSMGCLEPGCHLITGIESQVTNLQGALTVAPNPVRAGEAVQVSISLPPSITPQGPLRLTVVSSEGRVVHTQLIGAGGMLQTLPSTSPRPPFDSSVASRLAEYSYGIAQGRPSEGVSSFSFGLSSLSSGLYHLHLSDGTRWLAGAKVVVE